MSEQLLPVGLQYAAAFALNGTLIDPPADAVFYTGVQFIGSRQLAMTIPQARKITFMGENNVIGVDYLPATEAMDGELSVSAIDFDLIALLSGLEVSQIGTANALALATDQQGQEPQVGMYVYQQALSNGIRFWRTVVFPSAKCVYTPPGMSENPEDAKYKVGPTVVKKQLWGTQLTLDDNGCKSMRAFEIQSRYKPMLGAWRGNGVATEIEFPEDQPAVDEDTIVVWDSTGAEVVSGITKATTGITFTDPTLYQLNDFYTIFYQWD